MNESSHLRSVRADDKQYINKEMLLNRQVLMLHFKQYQWLLSEMKTFILLMNEFILDILWSFFMRTYIRYIVSRDNK